MHDITANTTAIREDLVIYLFALLFEGIFYDGIYDIKDGVL
jgi:hypothetical protein